MGIMQELELRLSGEQFRRVACVGVREALKALSEPESPLLLAFFSRFRGPIGSDVTGFQLLDAIDETPCMVSATNAIRAKFGLGHNWIVLSDLVADAVIVHNAADDKVFDLDFEGGVELLKAGELEPMHQSLESFLRWFFELKPA